MKVDLIPAFASKNKLKSLAIVCGLGLLVCLAEGQDVLQRQSTRTPSPVESGPVLTLFQQQRSGVMVTVDAVVVRLLADDTHGDRHQRFVIKTPDAGTLLVAHNIDLAPRVPLRVGDPVRVHGQYEFNEKGGVLHWTHRDPAKRHAQGWIEHAGRRYW